MATSLTKTEQADLRACEQVIAKGLKTFRDVGQALARIRDGKLYRQTHKSFDAYCAEKCGFGRSHAYRLIEAAGVPEVSPTGDKIDTERQARKHLAEQRQEQDEPDDPDIDEPDVIDAAPAAVPPADLNRVGWWLEQLDAVWGRYEARYGDEASWMYARIAIEQFAIAKGGE